MLTLNKLRDFGADVDAELKRCLNNEKLYLMLVNKSLNENRLSDLEQQKNSKDFYSAFETAHAMKGMYLNLSLTPLSTPISEMTDLLRNRVDIDYSSLMHEAKMQFQRLCNL